MYQHDPQGTGRSQYAGPSRGEITAIYEDSSFFRSSVTIDENDMLYYCTLFNDLRKHDPRLNMIWSIDLIEHVSANYSTPVIGDGNIIYVVSGKRTWEGNIHAIGTDGTEQWRYHFTDGIGYDVTPDKEGNLYFINESTSNLLSLTPDGVLRWELTVPDGFVGYHTPVYFSPDGNTFYASGNDSLYLITTAGEIQWGYPISSLTSHCLVDNDGNIYFHTHGNNTILSINPFRELNWTVHTDSLDIRWIDWEKAPTMDRYGNLYFAAVTYEGGAIVSFDSRDGTLRWKTQVNGGVGSNLICDKNSNIFFGVHGDPVVYCISSSGDILWIVNTSVGEAGLQNSPAIGRNGQLYFPVAVSHEKILVVE